MPAPPRPSTAALVFAWCGAALFGFALGYFLYRYTVGFDAAPPGGPVLAPLAVNVALFSIFALHHSLLARSGAKVWMRTRVPPALERSIYTWTASLLFIGVCACWQPLPGRLYHADGVLAIGPMLLQAAGLVITARSSARLDVLDLAGVRPLLQQSTPKHVPLETRGLYGVVRHPVYLGWVLIVCGAPDMTATRAAFAVISTAYLVAAIPFEERSLVELFGADYRAYQRQVRWRLLPGIY